MGTNYYGKAVKKHTDFDGETQLKKYEKKGLKVVRVGFVSTPDTESRLSRAIDILLESASRKRKKEELPKDSRTEKITVQNDGERG